MVDGYQLKKQSISFMGSDSSITDQLPAALPKEFVLISTEEHQNQAHSKLNAAVHKNSCLMHIPSVLCIFT